MKISRQTKSAVNRRANFVSAALRNVFAARMRAAIEAGTLADQGVENWWPPGFDPRTVHEARVAGGAEAVNAAADVCGNCDCEMPDGCGGIFRGDMSCEIRKRGLVVKDPPRWPAPASITVTQITDPLDAF